MFSIFDITDTARLFHSANISELMDDPPGIEAQIAASRRGRHEASTNRNRADSRYRKRKRRIRVHPGTPADARGRRIA